MTTAARLLREVRRARGLSQRALASLTPEHQSSIADFERGKHDPAVDRLDRLLAALGYSVSVLPTRRRTVADAADAVHDWLRHEDADWAYRELIQLNDDLAAEHGPLRVALTVAPPASVGDPRFDAFIAALVEHHLAAERLPIPDWTSDPSRRLDQAWVVDEWGSDDVTEVTPKAFRRHNVLIDPSELASA
jgi:transcriptional regulator with XRE-family HTH domain